MIINHKNPVPVIVLFTTLLVIFSVNIYPQSYNVSGIVSTAAVPVKYAEISFIDINDTTNVFSGVTDNTGHYQLNIITSVHEDDFKPVSFKLEQNYPNPFLSSTNIPYRLNKQSDAQVTIYDILGKEVKKFSAGIQKSGIYNITWDGKNNLGKKVAAGIYLYQLKAGGETQVRKMVFGIYENKFNVSLQKIFPSQFPATKSINFFSGSYIVRIENTDSTFPAISPEEIKNITVQSDTAFNFTVRALNEAVIYMDSVKQVISGFGGQNMPGWINDMTPAMVNTAFRNGNGQLGLTILRIRVPYDNTKFFLEVPTAQLASSLGAKVIASPWTPPAWMKSNNNIVGGRLNDTSYDSYAAHLKSFGDFLSPSGVHLHAISLQNEPDISVTYESCDWTAAEMLKFVKENGPSVGYDILVPESFNFNHSISNTILNDSIGAANVKIIGGHIYGGGLAPYPLAASKGKELWMTEHLEVNTTWSGALVTGKEINDCINAGMNAYIWWYIRRFYGLIDDNGSVTKRGYVMSQFARFIRPGSIRIDAPYNPQQDVYITAYKFQNNKIVIAALNMSGSAKDQTFTIKDWTVDKFTPYVTSETKNCLQEADIPAVNNSFNATLEKSSITTFVYE